MENLEILKKIERVNAPSSLWQNIQYKINSESRPISTKWLSAAAVAFIFILSGNIYAAKNKSHLLDSTNTPEYRLTSNNTIYE